MAGVLLLLLCLRPHKARLSTTTSEYDPGASIYRPYYFYVPAMTELLLCYEDDAVLHRVKIELSLLFGRAFVTLPATAGGSSAPSELLGVSRGTGSGFVTRSTLGLNIDNSFEALNFDPSGFGSFGCDTGRPRKFVKFFMWLELPATPCSSVANAISVWEVFLFVLTLPLIALELRAA